MTTERKWLVQEVSMDTSLAQVYDEFAASYEANLNLFDMSEVFSSFCQHLPDKQGSLLDLGCGAGEPCARWFIERGWTVTGVDFSQRMLALASKHVPAMEAVHADMRQLEFPPERFDAITASYSLFHVPSDEHAALFAKCRRWLCPQGKMLFTYATKDYTGSDEFDGWKEFMGKKLYYSHKRPETLLATLAQAGFSVNAAERRSIGGETFLWITAGS